jgi:hypothetical protein
MKMTKRERQQLAKDLQLFLHQAGFRRVVKDDYSMRIFSRRMKNDTTIYVHTSINKENSIIGKNKKFIKVSVTYEPTSMMNKKLKEVGMVGGIHISLERWDVETTMKHIQTGILEAYKRSHVGICDKCKKPQFISKKDHKVCVSACWQRDMKPFF